ncbi:type II toxin-antitoxin system VapC family toxin [Acinetobacter populi]|uniref:type II toxin-antitoxin system VapC family toxin n=1 Tax=Acinetobacter TaxID=469 RepID=UPI002352B67B|nr:type II toxin-antitoxin system VapC family toxin [Acinetobacter populi]MCH4248589.1 type II toxin-antitoxin system VapC family toxin [Acinetobacter populi]
MIIDTDVLIWYLRGKASAKIIVEANLPFSISSVTYMELLQGMKNKQESYRFQKALHYWNVNIIHIDQDISARATFYVQEYALSHAMQMADALIAATAIQFAETLLTANDKHYKFIPHLNIQKFIAE